VGPRFFYAGQALSMTGGHGDFRPLADAACGCAAVASLCTLADGVDACIKAAREVLRTGAHCIKIMGSGGVASPTDPLWMNQYREDEIRAIVGEAVERRSYVTAHCHPASAVKRCVEYGVRCIEHGTLIDDETARFVAAQGAYIVPTMATIFALIEVGKSLGFPADSQAKMQVAHEGALAGMERMRQAGVKVGFGTDLLAEHHDRQGIEFEIRAEVLDPYDVLVSATSVAAEIIMEEERLGVIAPGAHADILLVDGNPLEDVRILGRGGSNFPVIMKAGVFHKNECRP